MNKFKKIVVSVLTAVTVGTVGVSAFAATNYTHYNFNLSPRVGGHAFTSAAEKEDNLDYATALCLDGTVSNTRYAVFSVYESPTYVATKCITNTVLVTDCNNAYYNMYYNKARGAGSKNYLCASAGTYSVNISGRWDS